MFKISKNIVTGMIAVLTCAAALLLYFVYASTQGTIAAIIVGLILMASPQIVLEWERGILLRLGKFNRVLKPGITLIIPGIDVISSIVDMRIRTTAFAAEKALTKDTVPVDVDAVLFWVVVDAKLAILEVEHYEQTINWVAQTTLRDVIGRSGLSKMISDREGLDEELLTIIDHKTSEWGITIQSVEIRDVKIPASLEDAMSRMAQADREKEARITLSQSEVDIAAQMEEAAKVYNKNSVALQLRMMNITYESIKEKGALMVIPSNMNDSLSGQMMGMASAGFKVGNTGEEEG